jgi:hypothetical protein
MNKNTAKTTEPIWDSRNSDEPNLQSDGGLKEWVKCSDCLPSEGVIVKTKIDDRQGCRNEGMHLKRHGNLWFIPDGTMYVYYTPTHWMTLG